MDRQNEALKCPHGRDEKGRNPMQDGPKIVVKETIGDPKPYNADDKNSTPVTQAPKPPIEALAESVQDNMSKSTVPPTYWLKTFEKRGVYVIEATHGSNKNIYHNDICK